MAVGIHSLGSRQRGESEASGVLRFGFESRHHPGVGADALTPLCLSFFFGTLGWSHHPLLKGDQIQHIRAASDDAGLCNVV